MTQPAENGDRSLNLTRSDPLLTGLLLLVVLLAWEGAIRWLHVPAWLVPPPSTVAATLLRDAYPLIWRHTWVTLQEIGAGMAAGGGVGLALCILLAYVQRAGRVLSPFVLAVQTTPKIALAPLFVVWFGFGLTSKIVIVALITFFPIMVNAVAGFAALDPGISEMMRSLSATRRQSFLLARLPAALPSLFAGVRIAVVQSVVGAVAAEFVGAKEGLGYLVMYTGSLLQTDRLFAVLVVLLLLGLVLYWVVVALERRVVTWS
jgi:NitT/TauT family transport system permease protein